MIDELRREGDEPEEIDTRELFQKGKMSGTQIAREKHREQFEAEYMTRVKVDKRDR